MHSTRYLVTFRLIAVFILLSHFIMSALSARSRVAVVTGANKGIGLEIVRQLGAEPNLKTILACRNQELGEAAAKDLAAAGYDVEVSVCDIGSEESIDRFARYLHDRYPRVDILVNNAAIAFKGSDPTPFERQVVTCSHLVIFRLIFKLLLVPGGSHSVGELLRYSKTNTRVATTTAKVNQSSDCQCCKSSWYIYPYSCDE